MPLLERSELPAPAMTALPLREQCHEPSVRSASEELAVLAQSAQALIDAMAQSHLDQCSQAPLHTTPEWQPEPSTQEAQALLRTPEPIVRDWQPELSTLAAKASTDMPAEVESPVDLRALTVKTLLVKRVPEELSVALLLEPSIPRGHSGLAPAEALVQPMQCTVESPVESPLETLQKLPEVLQANAELTQPGSELPSGIVCMEPRPATPLPAKVLCLDALAAFAEREAAAAATQEVGMVPDVDPLVATPELLQLGSPVSPRQQSALDVSALGETAIQPSPFQDTFLACGGCIPAGNDLLVARMSVECAKVKCAELPGCRGFTFNGHDTEGNANIFFKSAWTILPVQGRAWTSYRYVKAGQFEDACSAEMLVHRVLQPSSNVDFPQITELCHLAESNSHDMAATVGLLGAVLCGPAGFRDKLKVLTIMNEMLYSCEALAHLCDAPGLLSELADLRCARETGLGVAADESIRMLATEVQKACVYPPSFSPARGHRHLHLPSAPAVRSKLERTTYAMIESAERTTSVMIESAEKTTSAMLESAEKAAAESLGLALYNIEKGVDNTAATALTVQKALHGVRSYILAELPSLPSFKQRLEPFTCELSGDDDSSVDEFVDGGCTSEGELTVEQRRLIPTLEPHQVRWQRQRVLL